jgi:Fis family transcriptional regulator
MGMGKTTQKMAEYGAKSSSAVEEILEKKIEDIVNLLGATERGKSTLYEDVFTLVERCLFRIALKRCNHVQTSAAVFLGINRNTLHKKIVQLDLEENE